MTHVAAPSRRTPLIVGCLVVAMTLALLPFGGLRGGASTSFVPAMLAIVLCFDVLSVYLLVGDFRDSGEPRVLVMAAAYSWSLVLMGAYALAFPGVLPHPPLAVTPSVAPWLYIGWHAGFPVLLGVAWAPWPPRFGMPIIEIGRHRAVVLVLASITALAGGACAAAVLDARGLPVLIHGLDTSRMATLTAPIVVPLVILAVVATARGCWHRTGPERWSAIAVLVCLCDLALTYTSHFRYSLGWYAGRTMTLAAAGVLLIAMLADVRSAKARATHNAAHDELTGLYNRRSVHDQLAQLASRSRRSGAPLSVLLIDLDLFKRVNDSLGHDVGDTVLRTVAANMHATVRRGDVVARVGGEEFLVVLPDTGLDQAHVVAEKLRATLREVTLPGVSAVTASMGVTTLFDGDTVPVMLRRADQAMYRAKAGGRDRVIYADRAEPWIPSPGGTVAIAPIPWPAEVAPHGAPMR